jgi:hypothetical protein
MKYSNDCRRISQLIIAQRNLIALLDASMKDRLKPYKDLLIDMMIVDPNAKDKVLELLKYQHYLNEIQAFSEWIPPRFPITGGMLASKGIKQGPNYKLILNQLREVWKQWSYEIDESRLLEEILPIVLENVTQTNEQSTVSKSKADASRNTVLKRLKHT